MRTIQLIPALSVALNFLFTSGINAVDESHFAKLGEHRIHYVLAGRGEPAIVLVHGWGGSVETWNLQLPELQKRFRTLAVDLPGYGKSDKPERPYTVEYFAQGVDAAMKHAKVERAILVGFSMGTPVIAKLYQMYPEKVAGLLTLDGSLRGFDMPKERQDKWLGTYKTPEYKTVVTEFVNSMFPNAGTEKLKDEVLKTALATPQHVLVGSFEGMLDKTSWEPRRIEAPLLVVNAKSKIWPEDYETFVKTLQPNASYKVIEGTGHFLMLEKPAEINAAIMQFAQTSKASKKVSGTDSEKSWQPLFDGKSLAGWRSFPKTDAAIPSGWKVEDGILKKLSKKNGGNIVTEETFEDFDLEWEWRLDPGGNNGLKYLVTESRPGAPGHEYQMIDDSGHPDAKVAKRLTATFYDVLPTTGNKKLKTVGEWNHSRVLIQGNHVEHWLNREKVLEYELGSEAVLAAVAQSKFKKDANFGLKIKGHIMLTDHGDEAWFRNIRIKKLD